ncbi:hypothetical protein [Enterovibrio calviensis]|uniref:hypothetical protein n=1 Tax=Enterovibrio calviensis TaxID=91359 RepID=UPI000480467D|nr:hypothetical protein [Enterovibrio calviensis]
MNGNNKMHYSRPYPDQIDRIFRDHFRKWPRRFKWAVFFCFLLPISFYAALVDGMFAPSFLSILVIVFISINSVVILWGLRLNSFAQRYWHRNYHIVGTTTLAVVPLSLLAIQYSKYCI